VVTQLALADPVGAPALAHQAQSDTQLVNLWRHGRSVHTQDAYCRDVARFLAHVPAPLASVTLGDVQVFAEDLLTLAPASRAWTLEVLKSLLPFGTASATCRSRLTTTTPAPRRASRWRSAS
jgi:hypothetical protein